MSQHTPGPWKITDDMNGHLTITGDRQRGTSVVIATTGIALGRGIPRRDANARLIAKAPEMLALLAQIAGTRKWALSSSQLVNDARALLREITGNLGMEGQ